MFRVWVDSILYDLTCYTDNLNLDTTSNDIQNIKNSLLTLNWNMLKHKTQNV